LNIQNIFNMKRFLIIFILIPLFESVFATDYHISASGNDAANGLSESSPWRTIAKVNLEFGRFNPGDRILFKRGDTFYGTLKVSKSGLPGHPILISAYGSGANPVITGFTVISLWKPESNGIYSSTVNCQSSPNIVVINGVNTPMGRYPNTGYLTYEAHSGTSSITDKQLSAAPNWTGAEIVIRKNAWILDRNLITNHNSNILFYKALGAINTPTDGFGYFFQNDIKTLDKAGEWYCSGSKIYMFFGEAEPANYVVKVSTLDQLVNIVGQNCVIVEQLELEGANKCGLNVMNYSNHISVQNCSLSFSGNWALNVQAYSTYFSMDNCTINYTNDTGIMIRDGSNNANITNSLIQNTATIAGTFSTWGARAISINSDNSLVQYNRIINTGYNGIQWYGSNASVKNNLIDTFCTMMDDGAGIYTTGLENGRVISGNIILNGKGNPEGTNNPDYYPAEGIYLDEPCANVLVDSNTVAFCAHDGIKLHEAHDNIITNNTCFGNKNQIEFNASGAQPSHPIRNNTIKYNIFFAKTAEQFTLSYLTGTEGIHPGICDHNYYSRPVKDDKSFNIFQDGLDPWPGAPHSLSQWRSISKQDSNSNKAAVTLTFPNNKTDPETIKFIYNATKKKADYNARGVFSDVTGEKYYRFSLPPFTSVVLINNTPIPQYFTGQIYSVVMFPNIPGNLLNIVIPSILGEVHVLIFDKTGKIVHKEIIKSGSSAIDISHLVTGEYLFFFDSPLYISPCRFERN
jgi:parallel beta-helix repeat protein